MNGNGGNRTFVLIKPDAIERGLTGEILRRFERKGFRVVKAEMRYVSKDLARKHYAEHQSNGPYFQKMIDAITCGPVIAMILEGDNAVVASRQLIGSAQPHHSHVGTIRGDLATQEAYNLVHGADSDPAAWREISLWFGDEWLPTKTSPAPSLYGLKLKFEDLMPKPGVSVADKHPIALENKKIQYAFDPEMLSNTLSQTFEVNDQEEADEYV